MRQCDCQPCSAVPMGAHGLRQGGSSSAKPPATRAPVALILRRRSSIPSLIIPVPSKSDKRAMARGALTMGW
eukprot:7587186-Lingulodinium_polyedra.AAC.1